MNKENEFDWAFRSLLATFVEVTSEERDGTILVNHEHFYNTQYYINNKKHIDKIQQLIDEKAEFQSRIDKLVIGSKWSCQANCLAMLTNTTGYAQISELTIGKGVIIERMSLWNIKISFRNDYYTMPINQFLHCFKPIEKGE